MVFSSDIFSYDLVLDAPQAESDGLEFQHRHDALRILVDGLALEALSRQPLNGVMQ